MKFKSYLLLFLSLFFFQTFFAADFRSSVFYWKSSLTEQEFSELQSKRENLEVVSYFETFDKSDLFELRLKTNDAIVEFVDFLKASKSSFSNIFVEYVTSLVKMAFINLKKGGNHKEALKSVLLSLDKMSREIDCLDYSLLENDDIKNLCFKFENLKVLMQLLVYSRPSETNKIKSQYLFKDFFEHEVEDAFLFKMTVDSILLWEIGKKILEDKGFLDILTKGDSSFEDKRDISYLEVEWQRELDGIKNLGCK